MSDNSGSIPLIIRQLGVQDYPPVYQAMRDAVNQRDNSSSDEIWLVEHNPVFTQGQAGKAEYIFNPGKIPVVQSDRGGQVTYHGPGQITAYLLIDLKRRKIGVRDLVSLIEQAVVDTLNHWGVKASPRRDAPGVYVEGGKKIASLGLRIRKGCSYHGLNLNVVMDMSPWQQINPCGLGVEMTQLADLLSPVPGLQQVSDKLSESLSHRLGNRDFQVSTDQSLIDCYNLSL